MLCLSLAACSGTRAATSPPARPSQSPAASPAQPASGPPAAASVKANWQAFFSSTTSLPRRLALLQDGGQFASWAQSQAKTSAGALVLQVAATVSSVRLVPPDGATVTYTILLSGKPLAKDVQGNAVYTDGQWKVSVTTFCGLLRLAYGTNSRSVPTACGG